MRGAWGLLLFVLAWPAVAGAQPPSTAAAAPSTRAEALEAQRARRELDLHPDEPGRIERTLLYVEEHRLIERLNPPAPLTFRSNHASNALALAGELPRDRKRLLTQLERARAGCVSLRPEWLRGY